MFLGAVMAAIPLAASGDDVIASDMKPVRVRHGQDRFGEPKGLGISAIDVKVATADSGGSLLVIENTNRAKGGPARHLHLDQDELFFVLDGEYAVEVGEERFSLTVGDSLLAPRRIPHVWAYTVSGVGRLLITFSPAGEMEAFFRAVAQLGAMPPLDPALWRAHGMELLGPPLAV